MQRRQPIRPFWRQRMGDGDESESSDQSERRYCKTHGRVNRRPASRNNVCVRHPATLAQERRVGQGESERGGAGKTSSSTTRTTLSTGLNWLATLMLGSRRRQSRYRPAFRVYRAIGSRFEQLAPTNWFQQFSPRRARLSFRASSSNSAGSLTRCSFGRRAINVNPIPLVRGNQQGLSSSFTST